MVRRRKREGKVSKTLTDFKVIFEPIFLPEDQDNERINQIADQILRCVARAKRECERIKQCASETGKLFEANYDEIFGLS